MSFSNIKPTNQALNSLFWQETYLTMDKKNHDIEVLRTLAIVFVILAHIPGIFAPDSFYFRIISISKFGSGVDLFFCVSGFIITKSLLGKNFHLMEKGEFLSSAKDFYIKRAWRLMPAALFWIAISLTLSFALESYEIFTTPIEMIKSSFFSITQTQNFYFPFCRMEGVCGNLGIYWSLSLENQFYLILPIILFMLNNKKLCWMMFFVFLVQFFIPRTLNSETPFAWPIRTDAIALGVIIAVVSTKPFFVKLSRIIPNTALFSAVTFALISFLLALFTNPNPIVFFQTGLTALLSGILVLIASVNNNFFARNTAITSVCDYIGSRSYSIYLTHFIVLVIVNGFFLKGISTSTWPESIFHIILFLSGTLILSEFSYKLIENKFRYFWMKNKSYI